MQSASFPRVTAEQWRAQVDMELAGAPFDKTLVTRTPEGLAIQPLYLEGPTGEPIVVEAQDEAFRICVRIPPEATREEVTAELEGGAEALWVALPADGSGTVLAGLALEKTFLVIDP